MVLDVLISELKPKDLHETISDQLEAKYLSGSAQELDEVKGIMFGRSRRLVGLMTMKIKRNIKNIYFLVDTGSPETSICNEVLNSYNLTILNPYRPHDSIQVRLNKREMDVALSPVGSFYNGINLLGTDFLGKYRAQLFADFGERTFTIKFQDQTSEEPLSTIVPTQVQTSTIDTANINLMVFIGIICIVAMILMRFRNNL